MVTSYLPAPLESLHLAVVNATLCPIPAPPSFPSFPPFALKQHLIFFSFQHFKFAVAHLIRHLSSSWGLVSWPLLQFCRQKIHPAFTFFFFSLERVSVRTNTCISIFVGTFFYIRQVPQPGNHPNSSLNHNLNPVPTLKLSSFDVVGTRKTVPM